MTNNEFWAQSYQSYLHLLGLAQLDKGLVDRVDLSGVVQTTLLEAFQQSTPDLVDEEQRRVWLRRLFLNNLLDALRKLRAHKRDIRSEVPLDQAIGNSAARLHEFLASDESTPSIKAMRNERADSLLKAIAELPQSQREAIELHHLRGLSLAAVANQMQRPKGAVAALIYRGMQGLRSSSTIQSASGNELRNKAESP